MKVLFIGGTGTISSACARRLVEDGAELTCLVRGKSVGRPLPSRAEVLHADVSVPGAVESAIGGRRFDVAVDFVAFELPQVEADIARFSGRVGQYVFISSASAYRKPVRSLPIVESTTLANPYWQYSRNKIACEDRLVRAVREEAFPATIVRPSHTYDRCSVPLLGRWGDVERMRRGEPVLVHGDGTSLWVLTHHDDFAGAFVGLLGNPKAVGESFHVTSDQVLTWNEIYEAVARAAGAEPRLVHLASEAVAALEPELGAALLGDKAHSVIFDNTKVKRLVPGWEAVIPFSAGAQEIVAWHDADASRRTPEHRLEATMAALVKAALSNGGPAGSG